MAVKLIGSNYFVVVDNDDDDDDGTDADASMCLEGWLVGWLVILPDMCQASSCPIEAQKRLMLTQRHIASV